MTIKIIFAGGGTAGHVEPALAVASWLRSKKPDWQYQFIGTKTGLENQLVPEAGFELRHVLAGENSNSNLAGNKDL